MSIEDTKKEMERLTAERDSLFREMAQKFADLSFAEVEQYKARIEATARRISGLKGAITRGT